MSVTVIHIFHSSVKESLSAITSCYYNLLVFLFAIWKVLSFSKGFPVWKDFSLFQHYWDSESNISLPAPSASFRCFYSIYPCYGFSSGHVWMWELDCEESWMPKNWCFDAFELWCCRRLLRVPRTARRSNQSILKEISSGCSLEGMMQKLKLQYFGHLMRRVDSLEKTLMLGGIEGRRRRDNRGWDGWMASPTRWTWVRVNSGSWWWTGRLGVLWFMGSQRVRHDWVTELDWT